MRATPHDPGATANAAPADGLLDRARAGDADAFRVLTEPYRHEIEVHCYRILGSAQDAEDLLQETLLAAWRGLDGFAGRSSLRAWLYRIATNRCLNALRDAGRRPREMPPPLDLPPGSPPAAGHDEPVWLEPYPDVLLERVPDAAPGPEARYEAREAIGLAFVTGLQRLPPIQRAVLVLRDVHGFRAAEVAEMLDTSEAAVTSALQRARATLEARLPARDRERAPAPRSARERDLVGRFADAFEGGDIDALVALLTEDARLTMPPHPARWEGATAIGAFLSTVPLRGALRRFRLVPTRANGQPAFAFYVRVPWAPVARAAGILVLTLEGGRIAAMTVFHDTSLLPRFGLPRTLRE
jgi:RNA polymerase sigma-70 factor (TIGR02960 family)